jgi:hypothetical protein
MRTIDRSVRSRARLIQASVPDSPSAEDIVNETARLHAAIHKSLPPARIAEALAAATERWRARDFAGRRDAISQISGRFGFSIPLIDESLDALLLPFTRDALKAATSRIFGRRQVMGFVMAGNAVGAGLHEVVLALMAGAGLLIKTASQEPVFFKEFANTLTREDPEVGSRFSVLTWPRERDDLTKMLRAQTDCVVAYGDDATIDGFGNRAIGFGSRLSGAVVTRKAMCASAADEVARRLARDVTLFEQLGCLSPHHVFVESDSGDEASRFADCLGAAMNDLAKKLPPPLALELEDAAALRSIRETARWRAIAGEAVRTIEGAELSWVVIFDRDAAFTPSPGLRCVRVSAIPTLVDLKAKFAPVRGRIEAIAIAGSAQEVSTLRELLAQTGTSYFAEPGAMQSPPLTWRHGGGAFLDRMIERQ